MADENANLNNPFGVQNTLEMGGIGDATLIQDLMEPETSTADPNEIKQIGEDADPPKKEEAKTKGKEIIPKADNPEEEEDNPSAEQVISSFLGSEDDEEGKEKDQ